MDRDAVLRWVSRYEQVWRELDLDGVEALFTEDVRYRPSPYEPSLVGYAALKAFWTEDSETFSMSAVPVAVEDETAVVRVVVQYGVPVRQEYTDLWLLHFAADGRVDDFEEWASWPGLDFTAPDP